MKLSAGTVIYHGTDHPDFDGECDDLDGPAWVSTSRSVADRFARRPGWGGPARVMVYQLREDVELPAMHSKADRDALEEEHHISFESAEDMRDSVKVSGLPGWIIPHNYPDGDDILLVDTSVLEFIRAEPCAEVDAGLSVSSRIRP